MQAASASAGCRTGRLLGKLTPTPEDFTRLIGMMPRAIWHGYTGRRTAGSAAHTALRNGVARRPASDDDLQLMLLRTSKPVRIGRRGVTLKLHGLELDFYTPELVNMRMKEKVYVRYDPEDLSSVRVYDMEDRFLCVAPQNKLTAGYLENQEQIADLMAAKRRAEKAVREYGAALRLPDDPDRALTLATALAQRNLDALDTFPSPKLIQLQQSAREEPLLKAVGDIDIGRMNENIIRQRGGIEDGKDL